MMVFSIHFAKSQNIIYSESFTQSSSYSAGSPQWDNWTTFRNSLDTVANRFTKVVVNGSNDATGRTCADPVLARQIAANLRNNSGASITCGGYTWRCGTVGSGVEFSVDGSLNACSNPGFTVRPQIGAGNSNWGGLSSATCTGPTQTMKIEFFKPSKQHDMGVASITTPNICDYTQSITANLTNFGLARVDSFRLYWSINGVTQTPQYIQSSLVPQKDTSILLSSNVSFSANTFYNIKVWTHRPNDQKDSIAENDTFRTSFQFFGGPAQPTTTDFVQCGNGMPTLVATPNLSSDSILWYDAQTGGNYLGMGRSIKGPYITSTSTFYAQSINFGGSNKLTTSLAGATAVSNDLTTNNGTMFDIVANKSTVLDSMTFKLSPLANTGANMDYLIYIKTGTHIGFETDPSAWTLLNSGKIDYFVDALGNLLARVSCKSFLINAGQTYGVYFSSDNTNPAAGGDIQLTNGVSSATNSDITIIPRIAIWGLFGSLGTYQTWSANVIVKTQQQCPNTQRKSLTVTVKPSPIGAEVVKGTPFNGQFNQGFTSNPDVVVPGNTVSWNLIPPTGYTNAGHGITWQIDNIEARTQYGVLVPQTEYTPNPPSSGGPGSLTFTGTNTYLDSLITFSVRFSDLGPHFCDSTITRTVYVAPIPVPDFTVGLPICLGQSATFNNTSTIHSGDNSYKWYFGDGDSSDFKSPEHTYANSGVYTVRLVATSSPWGIVREKTMQVTVSPMPVPNFTVFNACIGNNVTFQNSSSITSGIMNFSWDFGDGSNVFNTTSMSVPSKNYPSVGNYKVNLTIDAGGCISSLTKDAFVFPKPVPMFQVPPSQVCERTNIQFNDESTLSSGLKGTFWNFGDGNTSSNPIEQHAFNGVNTYTVTLVSISEFNCKDSIKKTVTTRSAPQPNFTTNTFCEHKGTNFVNTTVETIANPIYTWTMSDGFSSNTKNVTNKKWSGIGPVSVTLNARFTNLCEASLTKSFDVLSQPISDFSVNDICSGETAKFFNSTTGDKSNIKYAWDFGNGGTDVIASPTRVYNNATTITYNVRMVAYYDGGCRDTLTKSLTVSASPICDFTIQNQGGLNNAFVPANTNYTKYEWFFGEGGYSTSVSPTYQYLNNGNFVVKLRATNAEGCTCESTKPINANTSVKTIQALNGISIYPNPNNGLFTITNTSQTPLKVEIFNVLGTKIATKQTDKGTISINLSDESKGIYLVKVTTNGQTSIHKVTIAD